MPARGWVQRQPLGVVGVIVPWNYPLFLSFGPLASIFAAGNRAMVKMSELTPRTNALMARLVAQHFSPEELAIVEGEADMGRQFAEQHWDHLIFTGSTEVGRHVMKAAAQNLVPVTLELGGKSPLYLGRGAHLQMAAERMQDKLLGEERDPYWVRALAGFTPGGLLLLFLGMYVLAFALATVLAVAQSKGADIGRISVVDRKSVV